MNIARQLTRLPNGVTVVTAEMPAMASVSLGIWVAVGGRNESAKFCGISHFIEHLLFKGTPRRNARRISQEIEGLGGYLNAFTSEENTCIYAKAHRRHLPEVLDVLTDMFQRSLFSPEEIRKERDVIKDEIAMYHDQPHQLVHDLLNETLWPNHPLGRPLTGSVRSLNRIQRPQLVSFYRSHYVGAATVVAAAGNLRHGPFVDKVRRQMRFWPQGSMPSFLPVNTKQHEPRICCHVKETAQTQVALGIRTCSRHDPRRYALRLLNALLGENMSSRLFQILREDLGLAYAVQSSANFFEDEGALVISAGLEPPKLLQVMTLIQKELRRLVEAAPSATELRRARDYVLGQVDLSMENSEHQMNWLGEHVLGYGKLVSPLEHKRALSRVRPSDIRRVAADFIRSERLSLALVSPVNEPPQLLRCLQI